MILFFLIKLLYYYHFGFRLLFLKKTCFLYKNIRLSCIVRKSNNNVAGVKM